MNWKHIAITFAIAGPVGTGLVAISHAQQPEEELGVEHAECALFGPKGERFRIAPRNRNSQSALTAAVTSMLGTAKTKAAEAAPGAESDNLIDAFVFKAIREAGAIPAAKTNDYEFCRRVSLDLTGRVPAVERLTQFVQSGDPAKRAKYVEELLASPEWADKWTMYFGDHFENTENNTQIQIFAQGRNSYQSYLKKSLEANTKYDVMRREMIAATGDNAWEKGELNWFGLGFMSGGPAQDTNDLQAANTAEKFLGISHENCILCHDGRRHLDTMSLWGKTETRREAWELAAFFTKSSMERVRVNPDNATPYYLRVLNRPTVADYALNTTTGNRPARQPLGALRNVTPNYPFAADGGRPRAGEPYRDALGRMISADIQFARATVNYFWKQFFGKGIVDPPNQFDLDRLDPDNPPPEPWTIQPSNPYLLNALAKEFQKNQFDLKWLMRTIAASDAYQLQSRYEGEWNPAWENLFARKFVRRLWGEEVVDAIAQVSYMPVTYAVTGGFPTVNWAMQLPGTRGLGNATVAPEFRVAGIVTTYANASFLDSFLRGNRVEEERRSDTSVAQILNVMNDRFVHDRTRAVGAGTTASLARRLLNKYSAATNDNLLINEMFLTVLSRPASPDEDRQSQVMLRQGTRQQKVEDLLWALYNKADFLFNY